MATKAPMSQKEGVFTALVDVLGTNEFGGKPVELDDSQKLQVRQQLVQMFKDREISYAGDLPDDKALLTYTGGLLNNWLRKDERLNGGGKYVPKNPGMRQGAGDPRMRAMRALLATVKGADRDLVQKEMDALQAQLKPKKEIDVSQLPPNLRHLVPQQNSNSEKATDEKK